MASGATSALRTNTQETCDPDGACKYTDRLSTIETRLGSIEQILREQGEMLAVATAELRKRNAALDRLTSILVVSDKGLLVDNREVKE